MNDINLYKDIQKFRKVHSKVATATSSVIKRHTWYLTEELIPFSLFNESLPEEIRSALAAKIGQLNSGKMEIRKPTLPALTSTSDLADFVGERSTLLFDLLEIPVTFLQHKKCSLQPEYNAVKRSLGNLSPLNDSCERALGLATCLNTNITKKEEWFQELVQVVEGHRKKYSNKTKKNLKSFY